MNKNSTEPSYGNGHFNLQNIVLFMYFQILKGSLIFNSLYDKKSLLHNKNKYIITNRIKEIDQK